MNLEYYNTPNPVEFNSSVLPSERPAFLDYVPDFEAMARVAEKFKNHKNIILIGNGGSLNSFFGYYFALKNSKTKKVHFLNTVDPDYIQELKDSLDPSDTVVVSASKSGENTTQLESCMQFLGYPIVFITGEGSPIAHMTEKLGATMIVHPPVGGRYAGLTEVALVPAAFCGFDIRALFEGAQAMYRDYEKNNLAWQAASTMWQLEQAGKVDVFVPVYSKHLAPFSQLIMQLCHESFGKMGLGQTYLSLEGPEWQHHSTQRFYGGQKNVAGIFITISKFSHEIINSVPTSVQNIPMRTGTLAALDKLSLAESMRSEILGNLEDVTNKHIPVIHLEIDARTAFEVGSFTAFWQMYAVYSSLLRGVNPFDQPEVESSKNISFIRRASFLKQ